MAGEYDNGGTWEPEAERREASQDAGRAPEGDRPVDEESRESDDPTSASQAQSSERPTFRMSALDSVPRLSARRRGRRLVKKPALPRAQLTPEQRLLILDTWRRSGLSAADFAAMVGVSKHTLYGWKRRFENRGPAGLVDQPKGGSKGSRLSELTKRAIVMLKEANPDWGCQRISDMLLRGPALPASPSAVARVLHEAGYQFEEVTRRAHGQEPKRFERERPNELWQTDLFTFTLKRQNRRVYLVAFLDDRSRFVVGYGLHATQSSALVLEVLRSAITNYQPPREILTDNGSQYVTWRGKSAFSKELGKHGVRHIVATPRRPQTLGKIERFWGSLWRECVERAVFVDLEDARRRLGWYVDHYNFQRPHQGIGGLVPADRYFDAAPEVLRTLKERVEKNALERARHGLPRVPFYLTGNAGGKPFSVHTEGERVFLTPSGGERREIVLDPESAEAEPSTSGSLEGPGQDRSLAPHGAPPDGELDERELAPGESALDRALREREHAGADDDDGVDDDVTSPESLRADSARTDSLDDEPRNDATSGGRS